MLPKYQMIGLAGRQGSGKSTAAKILREKGYELGSFAQPLKEALSKVFNWNLNNLYDQKYKEEVLDSPILWDEKNHKMFCDIVEETLPFEEEKEFDSRRQVMQYVGTDLARKYDVNFHVKQFLKKYKDKKVVCDDVRFPNEVRAIEDNDGLCVFIMRPFHWKYSNHSSETSLSRHGFKYVLKNIRDEEYLFNRASNFFDSMLSNEQPIIERDNLLNLLKECNWETTEVSKILKCSRDKIVWWAQRHLIDINKNKYFVDHDSFSRISPESSYYAGLFSADGTIKTHTKNNYLINFPSNDIELVEGFKNFIKSDAPTYSIKNKRNGKDKYSITISSHEMIEDFKLWNLEPRKSKFNKVPDIIKNNEEMLCYWLVGLIDGDGSIYNVKQSNNIGMSVLASKEIIDFIVNWLGISCSISQEKKIENLYNAKYSGKNVVAVYNKIYKGMGLTRKWSKVIPFLNKIWNH